MKSALSFILLTACVALASCATDPATGQKTFLGLSGSGWVGVAEDAGKAGVVSYGNRRSQIETTSGK